MQKIILCCGIPASGKSTWAKEEIKKDPEGTTRINRDDLRNMMSNYHFCDANEKLVTEASDAILKSALRKGRNIILDETNLTSRNFDKICLIVKELNISAMVMEKAFYVDLEEALLRNSKREGSGKIPEDVIHKMWKTSGGKQHKFYKIKCEIFNKSSKNIELMKQDDSLERAVIFDNDGTISLIHEDRSPYDASTCDFDIPHKHVIECMKLYYESGYKILFVSGREEKDREPTERFYKQHFPEIKYELFMRATGDSRKDVLIKEEIFDNYIKNKYYVAGWFDDRLQVCKWIYKMGLPLFRVNDPESNF